MKISFIATVFNEEKEIGKFLDSIFSQTKLPDEIIIVDGGSGDLTVVKIKDKRAKIKNYKGNFLIIIKKGNRSVGRNEAIKNATGEIIVCSDSGNILDKNWIKNIIKPFHDKKIDVVSGYYKGVGKTVFQKCLVPFALVMEDKIDPEDFLPSTRSIAFKKSIWEKIGGFPEQFSHNEDYVFAKHLEKIKAKRAFAQDAIVYWTPRNSYKSAYNMMYRFALGDGEAEIFRSKVLILIGRYLLGLYFLFLIILYRSLIGGLILLACIFLYVIWSIQKNYRYVKEKKAFTIFPLLQFTADAAVLTGTIVGLLNIVKKFNYLNYIKQNKFLFFILFIYIVILLLSLKWGIPNQDHPFPYHMDEWHQLQAVRTTYKYGTPNVAGSANGTMFDFVLSGFYLIPFTLTRFINPAVLKVNDLFMRERIFELLRINTIIWGILSIFTLYKITELLNASKKISIFLFTFTPIWLMLSGYFKYDISLTFWILLSLLYYLRFAKESTKRNFLLAAIPVGLAISVKISALPLLIIYIFSYFWFTNRKDRNYKYFLTGIVLFISIVFLFGAPDTIFGKGNILRYLYENIIAAPNASSSFQLGTNQYIYLYTRNFPLIFGHGIVVLFLISIVIWIYLFFQEGKKKFINNNQTEIFVLFCFFIFLISLLPLKIWASGNRSLVLLPFAVIFISAVYKKVAQYSGLKIIMTVCICLAIIIELLESFVWVNMKFQKMPQELASGWITHTIPAGQTIGLENIPIYQELPDLLQKEFYFKDSNIKQNYYYNYQIVDYKTAHLPSIIVLTDNIQTILDKKSPQRSLIVRLQREHYKKIASFSPDIRYYNLLGNKIDFYFAALLAAPAMTSIYKK